MSRNIAVIGAGTVGLGWLALFLAPALPRLCFDPAPLARRLTIKSTVEDAVDGVDVVQESGPERLDVKQELFARNERAAPAEALLLSSTSELLPDDIGASMRASGRVVVGHPLNPPHVFPLVEVVPGEQTEPTTISAAAGLYRSVGRTPVVLRKVVPKHVTPKRTRCCPRSRT